MESRPELIKVRYSVAEAAELIGKHPSHLRRLWKRGVLPEPRKTAGGRPYFDDELLTAIRTVMQSGIGRNGEEVLFYRQRAKNRRCNRSLRSGEQKPPASRDPYILSLKDALTQLGIPKDRLEPDAIQTQLAALHGDQRPDIKTVFHQLAKRMIERDVPRAGKFHTLLARSNTRSRLTARKEQSRWIFPMNTWLRSERYQGSNCCKLANVGHISMSSVHDTEQHENTPLYWVHIYGMTYNCEEAVP